MIIDFHVHAFADKIAEKAVSKLAEVSGFKPCTNGTISGLLSKMDEAGIDKSVVLPIATKPSQQTVINDWAKSIMNDRIYSFGSVHPDAEDALQEIHRIKELGLYGIKLHPDYQDFYVDDPKMYPIYSECVKCGLPITFHAGYDPISPHITHGMPDAFSRVFDEFPDLKVILAHLGGMLQWNLVEKYIAGRYDNVYLDIAAVADYITNEQALKLIRTHGADKILFASDIPWASPADLLNFINSLHLDYDEKLSILYKNAENLLISS